MEDRCQRETTRKLPCEARIQQTSYLLHLQTSVTWGVSTQNATLNWLFSLTPEQ